MKSPKDSELPKFMKEGRPPVGDEMKTWMAWCKTFNKIVTAEQLGRWMAAQKHNRILAFMDKYAERVATLLRSLKADLVSEDDEHGVYSLLMAVDQDARDEEDKDIMKRFEDVDSFEKFLEVRDRMIKAGRMSKESRPTSGAGPINETH